MLIFFIVILFFFKLQRFSGAIEIIVAEVSDSMDKPLRMDIV